MTPPVPSVSITVTYTSRTVTRWLLHHGPSRCTVPPPYQCYSRARLPATSSGLPLRHYSVPISSMPPPYLPVSLPSYSCSSFLPIRHASFLLPQPVAFRPKP
ncbi:hypothetical protein E2C01_025784 [Portunus trituberculatus]|uniref:Uncharacterized protein n=1 Tax=Portunus trituberculatus TaxID=210409 RepID=A0A5B7EIW5_PORTR|nr:hypothetical protein [Portunus trituberculatus]